MRKIMNTFLEKISDALMFREGTEEEADGSLQPIITTGSIVWGILLRSLIVFILSFAIMIYLENRTYGYMFFFIFWFVAAYPGWRQYQLFQTRIKKVEESTLCGSCINFESSSQLCKIFDEHVTRNYIPCEGLNWEPRHFDTVED